MKPTSTLPSLVRTGLAIAVAFATATLTTQAAENMYKSKHALPGGLTPRPYIEAMTVSNDTATVVIQGLQPPLQLLVTDDIAGGSWENQGPALPPGVYEIPLDGNELGFLNITSPNPNYVGASVCKSCHSATHTVWSETRHAHALDTLKAIGQDGNSRCLECHTVGHGFETGFIDEATTPGLAGVQCENCHGPGGSHVANIGDLSVRPKVTLAAETCGGCHTDAHHPTYDEWLDSRHAVMDDHVAGYFLDPERGQERMGTCGICHSGASRMAYLEVYPEKIDLETGENVEALPTNVDAAYFTVTCAVCHNPHIAGTQAQLRNPTYSTDFFSYSTRVNFADQYNADVQMCGQCHNQRGAQWTDTSRPPHHSTQYNLLTGLVAAPGTADGDEFNGAIHAHGDQLLQCAECHTHPHESDDLEEIPNYTGHRFEPTAHACLDCHTFWTEEIAELVIENSKVVTDERMTEVKAALDDWGLNRSPEPLRTQYGALAWEYSNEGGLSNPDGNPDLSGPSSAEQSAIPDSIKKARFALYLVYHDASNGLHNSPFAAQLLDQAETLANDTDPTP